MLDKIFPGLFRIRDYELCPTVINSQFLNIKPTLCCLSKSVPSGVAIVTRDCIAPQVIVREYVRYYVVGKGYIFLASAFR